MRHSKEVKEQATARMREGGTPLLELAREYRVSTNSLRTWLRESDARARAQDSAKRVATSLSGERYTSASQRQRLLMHALEQSPATIIVTDAEGKIVYANPKFCTTTGYTAKEAIGQNPRLLKSGETSQEEYRLLWKSIKAGKEWRGVFHNRRKDGSLYWERASISPVLDAKGKIAHFMAVKEDITQFMEADAARRRMAAGIDAVFNALPFAILLVDKSGDIQFANRAVEALFDTTLPRGIRFKDLNLLWANAAGAALPAAEHPLMRVLAGEGDSSGIHTRIGVAPPTGGMLWLQCLARPVVMPESEEAAALLVLMEDFGKS